MSYVWTDSAGNVGRCDFTVPRYGKNDLHVNIHPELVPCEKFQQTAIRLDRKCAGFILSQVGDRTGYIFVISD